jgi:Domain of unknown function (DUF4062)
MTLAAPTVMVSSTFYDLQQIRKDLADFLSKDLGFNPLLSEMNSFPIDPDADTIENCRRRVQKNADILILVIGGRYGYVDSESSRSVTNLEYLSARLKGIPIYIFIDKRVLSIMPVWKKNPDADFSGQVDNVKIFDFINEVRLDHKAWTHEFETAQDIISSLRNQFAYLTMNGINWMMRLHHSIETKTLQKLNGESLKIALEKPDHWEYKLVAQRLSEEINDVYELRQTHELGLALGIGESVSIVEFKNWSSRCCAELINLVNALNVLLNQTFKEAVGLPGQSGNLDPILFSTRKIGEIYKHSLEWSSRVRRAVLEESLSNINIEMAKFPDDILHSIENLGTQISSALEEALDNLTHNPGKRQEIELKFDIKLSNIEGYESVFEVVQENLSYQL